MKLSDIIAQLPFMRPAVERAAESLRDIVPYNPNRLFNEDSFKTETKSDFVETYEKHIWTYTTVYTIASNLASLPMRIYKLKRRGVRGEEMLEGAVFDLFNRPNPYDTYYDFIESLVSYLELTGDTFIEKNDPIAPTQMYVLRPDYMEINTSAKRLVTGYDYKPNGVRSIHFEPDDIIHIRYFHPRSELYGLSFTVPAANSTILDFYSINFLKRFFKNGGSIDKYVSVKSKLNKTEFERFSNEVQSKIQGDQNVGKVAVLDDEGKIVSITADFQKYRMQEQRDTSRNEIFSGSGVPPIMANLLTEHDTYNNAQTQEKAFWQNTMKPKARKVEGKFNVELLWKLGYECEFDFSGIAALQEDSLKKAQTSTTLVQGGIMTKDEVRETEYGLPPTPKDRAVQATETLASQIGVGGVQSLTDIVSQVGQGLITNEQGASLIQTLFGLDSVQAQRLVGSGPAIVDNGIEKGMSLRDEAEERVYDAVRSVFRSMMASVLKALPKDTVKKADDDIIETVAGVLDKETERVIDEIMAANKANYKRISEARIRSLKGGAQKFQELRDIAPKTEQAVAQWAKESGDSVVSTMKDRVSSFLQDAATRGADVDEMTAGIRDIFAGTERGKYPWARMIARTEATRMHGTASKDAFKAAGVKTKTWIASGPPGDRPDHTAIDGQTVSIDEPFRLPDGTKIQYPGDPNAPVKHTANCRCTMTEGD